jgi:hypothetical protein
MPRAKREIFVRGARTFSAGMDAAATATPRTGPSTHWLPSAAALRAARPPAGCGPSADVVENVGVPWLTAEDVATLETITPAAQHDPSKTFRRCQGIVVGRREHGKCLTFLTVHVLLPGLRGKVVGSAGDDGRDDPSPSRLLSSSTDDALSMQIVVVKQPKNVLAHVGLARPGATVSACGELGRDRDGNPQITVFAPLLPQASQPPTTTASLPFQLLRLRANPACVMNLLQNVSSGLIQPSAAQAALACDSETLARLLALLAATDEARLQAKADKERKKAERGSRVQGKAGVATAGDGEKEDGEDGEGGEVVDGPHGPDTGPPPLPASGPPPTVAAPKPVPPRLILKSHIVRTCRRLAGLPPLRNVARPFPPRSLLLLERELSDIRARGQPWVAAGLAEIEVAESDLLSDGPDEGDDDGADPCCGGDGGGGSCISFPFTAAAAEGEDADEDAAGKQEPAPSSLLPDADSILGPAHPRANIPSPSALPVGGPSSSYADRLRYLEEKKAPQVVWFIEALRGLVEGPVRNGRRFAHAVDVGGGRGDLGVGLARAVPSLLVTVLDINAPSVLAGRERAAQLGLTNLRFVVADVRDTASVALAATSAADGVEGGRGSSSSSSATPAAPRPDLFLGLHACGGLTDAILALAAEFRASFLVCPCCFRKNAHLAPFHPPHPSAWAPGAADDVVEEDVARATAADVEDAAAPAPEPWRFELLRLAEASHPAQRSVCTRAMLAVNVRRLEAAGRAFGAAGGADGGRAALGSLPELGLRAFPRALSGKNQVLVGVLPAAGDS